MRFRFSPPRIARSARSRVRAEASVRPGRSQRPRALPLLRSGPLRGGTRPRCTSDYLVHASVLADVGMWRWSSSCVRVHSIWSNLNPPTSLGDDTSDAGMPLPAEFSDADDKCVARRHVG